MREADRAGNLIAAGLRASEDRTLFLREVIAHAAAALSVLRGPEKAAEVLYGFADAAATEDSPS